MVDNGSRLNVEEELGRRYRAVFVREETRGVAAARNRGIAVSSGSILAFTDSDCIPSSDWIEKGVEYFISGANISIAGGMVDVFCHDPERPNMVELYERAVAFRQDKYIREQGTCIMANIFVDRKVFEDIGCLDESFMSCEDEEWTRRATGHGYDLVYARDARVSHPARGSFRELFEKCTRLTGGRYELEKRNYVPIGHSSIFVGYFTSTCRDVLGVFSDKGLPGIRQKSQVLLVMLFVRCVYIYERIRLMLGRAVRR